MLAAKAQETDEVSTTNKNPSEIEEEQFDDDEDEIEYEVYYNSHDIRKTLQNQDKNLFQDINQSRKVLFNEFNGVQNLK